MRLLACATAALLVAASAVRADTIRITSGALVYPAGPVGTIPPGITLNGSGFTFTGYTSPTDGLFVPLVQCGVPTCMAGTTVDLSVEVFGLGFRGATATYAGTTYDRIGGLGPLDPAMSASWDGSVAIPLAFTGGTLTAPFTFSGAFTTFGPAGPTNRVDLAGAGTATISFAPFAPAAMFPGAFQITSLRYDFADVAPTPEPASLLLLGTGLAGLAAARRRRPRRA